MYKQLIIARRDLNMSPGKLSAQVAHASTAFLTTLLQDCVAKYPLYRHPAIDHETGEPILYRRGDFYKWAKEAAARGEDYFCARPVDPRDPYGEFELCEDEFIYKIYNVDLDSGLFEDWINGSFTKVVCGARDMKSLQRAIDRAVSLGMKEGIDFFVVRDECRTELTPEKDGTTVTCVGFKPMPAEIIDQIGKEYNLY